MDAAREALTGALQGLGLPALWTEWITDDPDCPGTYRGYGSPTILVNEADVAPGPHPWARRDEGDGPRCRLYRDDRGSMSGAPPADRIVRAVQDVIGPEVG